MEAVKLSRAEQWWTALLGAARREGKRCRFPARTHGGGPGTPPHVASWARGMDTCARCRCAAKRLASHKWKVLAIYWRERHQAVSRVDQTAKTKTEPRPPAARHHRSCQSKPRPQSYSSDRATSVDHTRERHRSGATVYHGDTSHYDEPPGQLQKHWYGSRLLSALCVLLCSGPPPAFWRAPHALRSAGVGWGRCGGTFSRAWSRALCGHVGPVPPATVARISCSGHGVARIPLCLSL
ncbi:hypothetical protein BS78_03G220700 [Paspalum vaginatum]|nr:hypothetical protein BS78_03G220700 [Paspalum vaginatum]